MELFVQKSFRIAAYICLGIVAAFWVAALTTSLTLCKPIALQWDKTLNGTCGNIGTAELAVAAINMVLDVVIVCLPLPVIWKLQMPVQKKIGVTAVFALGLR